VLSEEQNNSPPPSEERRERQASQMRQFGAIMELPFHIVGAVVLGVLFGFLLDRWLNTAPFLMILLGGCGFYAGLRDVWRRFSAGKGK
jgi:F0F1-type ATP synthase assembly protein I